MILKGKNGQYIAMLGHKNILTLKLQVLCLKVPDAPLQTGNQRVHVVHLFEHLSLLLQRALQVHIGLRSTHLQLVLGVSHLIASSLHI